MAIYFVAALTAWDGIGPRDAEKYIAAGLQWHEAGAFIGDNHWALRHLLVLPMAALFAVFGPSEFAACLPNLIYGAFLVLISFHFGRRYLGVAAGNIFTLLIATSAFLAIQSGELRVYGVEIVYLALSLWLFLEGFSGGEPKSRTLVIAGAAAGCAWLCREATIFLPMTMAAATLLLKAPFLRTLAPAALGFLAAPIGEMVFYGAAKGDAFYRYKIDLGHGGGNPGALVGGPIEGESILWYIIHPFTEVLSYPTVTPFVIISLAAAYWLISGKLIGAGQRPALTLFGLAAVFSFFVSGYPLSLEHVEYYPIVAYSAAMISAVAIAVMLKRYGAAPASTAIAALVLLNFAAADFRDYDEYDEARLLADLVEKYEEPIFSDPTSVVRSKTLLRLRGFSTEAAGRALESSQAIRPGMLIFQATPSGARYALPREAGWIEVGRYSPRRRSWTRGLLKILVPEAMRSRRLTEILRETKPVVLFRAPAASMESNAS